MGGFLEFFFAGTFGKENPHEKMATKKNTSFYSSRVCKFHEKTTKGIKAFFNEISQKHILSFWGKRPIFMGKLAVSFREGKSLSALFFCLFANHFVSKIAERWLKKHHFFGYFLNKTPTAKVAKKENIHCV